MSIITVGIDLAKNIFAVHGVNEAGKLELIKPKVTRYQLLPLVTNLPPCLICMEACTGAHHWARLFRQHGCQSAFPGRPGKCRTADFSE